MKSILRAFFFILFVSNSSITIGQETNWGREAYIAKYGESLTGPNNILSWYILVNSDHRIIRKQYSSTEFYPFNFSGSISELQNKIRIRRISDDFSDIAYAYRDIGFSISYHKEREHSDAYTEVQVRLPDCYCAFEEELKKLIPVTLFDKDPNMTFDQHTEKLENASINFANSLERYHEIYESRKGLSFIDKSFTQVFSNDDIKITEEYYLVKIGEHYYSPARKNESEGIMQRIKDPQTLKRLKFLPNEFSVRLFPTLKRCNEHAFQLIDNISSETFEFQRVYSVEIDD